MRTGVASGKKRASSATVVVCAVRDGLWLVAPSDDDPFPDKKTLCHSEPGEGPMRNLLFLSCYPKPINAVGLPFFPVRKSMGSQNSRLRLKQEHDQDHSAERKD